MDRKICPKGHCFGITRLCRVMPNSDPRDRFVCPYLTLMIDSFYTPGIYADGYIVFVFPFVRLYVRLFVRNSVTRQSFASKFLKWCISQQLLIRKRSYLDHSYPGGLAFTT